MPRHMKNEKLQGYPMKKMSDLLPENFYTEYWQNKPFVLKTAFTNSLSEISQILSSKNMQSLLISREVESKVVVVENKLQDFDYHWEEGPFNRSSLKAYNNQKSNFLVQKLNFHLPQLDEYFSFFDCIPNWARADIMLSLGVEGGSVGPHRDLYDVFILQIEGDRIWNFEKKKRYGEIHSKYEELEILSDFKIQQQIVLNPGDLLYIPPLVAHWGINKGSSTSLSFGFRRPDRKNLLRDLFDEFLETEKDQNRSRVHAAELADFLEYANPSKPNELSNNYLHAELRKLKEKVIKFERYLTENNIQNKIAEYLTGFQIEPLITEQEGQGRDLFRFKPGIKRIYFHNKKHYTVVLDGGTSLENLTLGAAKLLCDQDQFEIKHLKVLLNSEAAARNTMRTLWDENLIFSMVSNKA
ncbi:MAG: hypothetical protein KDK41_11440 [Leptospiraceae bacterium]|nr:hypothetical protein [Leptospiraceae bacterium]